MRGHWGRILFVLAVFLGAVCLIIGGVWALSVRHTVDRTTQAARFTSQALSSAAQSQLQAAPFARDDYLIAGSLRVAGTLDANTITPSASMVLGAKDQPLILQGGNVSLAATANGFTTTLQFASPTGRDATIVMPNVSGTVAVSASGPLVLDANGNLSCPSCKLAPTSSSVTNNVTNVTSTTNSYTTNILATGMANTSLSNLGNVAVNTNLLPGVSNTIDTGSATNTFRNGYYGTSVSAPLFDTVSASALNIGTTTATSINLGANTIVAAGKSLTVNGVASFQNTVNSANAFQIQDSNSVALLNANTTQGTLSVGTYIPTVVWATAPVTRTDYTSGTNTQSVTTADVNGDLKADLISSNISSNTISVFMNNGNGTFAPKVDYPTGVSPRGIASADLNGDGKSDVAVVNYSSNTISVFMNNGNGTFAPKVDYMTGTNPTFVKTADVNGDGKSDLIVANINSNTISVFMNNGNGTFAPKVDYMTGSSPWAITAADFNGDGKLDIAVTSSTSNTISVFMNNGNGTFAPKVDYTTGTTPYGITSADLNGDGKSDVAVTNVNSDTVSVFMNNGNGIFAPKVDYTTGYSTAPFSIASADFNGDNKPDLVVADNTGNAVSVLLNNGTGILTSKSDYPTGVGPSMLVTADFNGDGKPDVATANNNSGTVSVLLFGTMTGTPMTQSASKLAVNAAPNVVGQIIQATSGQTADLFQVKNDLNTSLFSIGATGNVATAGTSSVAGAFTANDVALFKNAVDSTTALRVQQASGVTVFGVDTANGRVGVGTNAPNNKLSVNGLYAFDPAAQVAIGSGSASNKGLIVQGVSYQTADLLQAQSSTGAVLASISATGDLKVASAVIAGTLTFNGHIVTGGVVPTIAAGAAACTVPTISITGNDTSGTVTITSGSGCSVTGSMATITFNSLFATTPRIMLTSNNANAANLKLYNGSATTASFTIDTATVLTAATTYTFNYWAVQ